MEGLTERKQIELRAFAAACQSGLPLTNDDVVPGEEPDLRVMTAARIVGVELTELLPLPRNESFSSTLAEESLHENSVRLAERTYYSAEDAIPVTVTVYPWQVERARNKKREMADALASFVRLHSRKADPVVTFERIHGIPDGFGVISICSAPGPWRSGKSVNITLDGIQQQLGDRIEAKNKLLPRYRVNLPNAPIWLLIFSCMEVSRGVPVPHGISEWSFPFDFERVFFFSSLSRCV